MKQSAIGIANVGSVWFRSGVSNIASAAAGGNVRAEMARRGISQATLGEWIGKSQASLSLRLNGHVAFTIDELVAIAAALEVPLTTLTEGVAA